MYIGIDLGGTNIACGLVDESGKIIKEASTKTLPHREFHEIVKDMASLIKTVVSNAGYTVSDIKSIGIGSPGTIDNKNGIITYANNLNVDNAPVADMIQEYYNVPVNVENDANAAAYGEYIAEGNGSDSFLFVTLGTGVGGGIVINGKIYRGFNGAGAEIGHSIICKDGIPCTCGRNGCWEQYASVTALIRQTKEKMEKNPHSLMHEIAAKYGHVNGRVAFDAARLGDDSGKLVVKNYLEYIGAGLADMLNIFQPELIVIGGGISKEGDYLLEPVKEYVYANDYNRFMKKTTIKIASLFNGAGIIGAAMAAKNKFGL